MSFLTVYHSTVYRYREPVGLGEHRMMFRPRASHDLRLQCRCDYRGLAVRRQHAASGPEDRAHASNVLITGPSGTGKELIARAIHAHSPRADKPFIAVDCAGVTGSLFAGHLFGHVKGAFTGAEHETLGCFRAADRGTIFLDEIGELDRELQGKLLRVLQERVVTPLGSHATVPVDVRVIVATNSDLEQMVAGGRFREDLFYRLNVVAVKTIPLRDRREDILPLAEYFLQKMAGRLGAPRRSYRITAWIACCSTTGRATFVSCRIFWNRRSCSPRTTRFGRILIPTSPIAFAFVLLGHLWGAHKTGMPNAVG